MDQVKIANSNLIEDFRCDLRLQRKTETTITNYCEWVRRFADFLGIDLLEVKRDDLKKYLDHLLNAQGMRATSIKFVFGCISSFYTFLVDESMIVDSPLPAFRRKYLRSYKNESASRPRQLISIPQAKLLVNSILDVKDKTVVVLLFKTGMRRH